MITLHRVLPKWNYELHEYEPMIVPAKWNCKMFSNDMSEIVRCPHCGASLPFGDTFTSLEVHNEVGMGYAVCPGCHREEIKRKLEAQS